MNTTSKVIWTFWDSGAHNAPELVRLCLDSWAKRNPDFVLNIIDSANLNFWLDESEILPREVFPSVQKYSNHIRLTLLLKYGGVWVDADLYCNQPLGEWLPSGEFFVFSKPTSTRRIANWFIAADKNSYVLRTLKEEYDGYFAANNFPQTSLRVVLSRVAERLLNICTALPRTRHFVADFWTSTFILRSLKLTPYFIFHYLFEKLLMGDERFEIEASAMKVLSAAPALQARRPISRNCQKLSIRKIANQGRELPPVVKLNYRNMRVANLSAWRELVKPVLS